MFNFLKKNPWGWVVLFFLSVLICSLFFLPKQNSITLFTNKPSQAVERRDNNLQSPLGVGLFGINDWSTELPFIDHFKTAKKWLTQCEYGQPQCDNNSAWDTQEYHLLKLDKDGWVKSLPKAKDAPKYTSVGTLLLREIPNQYPSGRYIVLYQGEGKIDYEFDAKKIDSESKPGRDVLEVDASKGGGIWLSIKETDPKRTGNYIRNIRVLEEKYESLYQKGEIFNPAFLAKINKFRALRFMDWMATNNSPQKEWKNRPTPTMVSYSLKGVPVEVMVALANKTHTDPWFNMPHQATPEYIKNFALIVKQKLDPNLKAYVEFSNEVWNWQFEQADYAEEQGKAKWGKDKQELFTNWYGMKAAQTCEIWQGVFQNQKQRIACVISTQTGWQGLEKSILECPLWVAEGHAPCYQGMDVYAITGYFSGKLGEKENLAKVQSWWQDSDGGFAKAIQQLKSGNLLGKIEESDSLANNRDIFLYQAKVAQEKGLQLVAYEGGQHIVGRDGLENNDKLTKFFMELNRRPEMYEVYTQQLNNWKQAGGTLFMHYVAISPPDKWGSWGALESLQQETSPKYQALLDFIDKNSCWWPGCAKK